MNVINEYQCTREKVKVEYDGSYPTLCYGTLCIYINDKMIAYTNTHTFSSTGSIGVDSEGDYYTEEGSLVWRDENYHNEFIQSIIKDYPEYSQEIIKKIDKTIGSIRPCCGGCI